MQRLGGAFVHGACDKVISDIVNELMGEKRVDRPVTVPTMLLEKVMVMVGNGAYRLHTIGSENGDDGDTFVREEREIMRVMRQALDGEDR